MKARDEFPMRLWFCGFALAQIVALWQGYGAWLVRAAGLHE